MVGWGLVPKPSCTITRQMRYAPMWRLLLASTQVVVSRFLPHTGCLKSPYQPDGETERSAVNTGGGVVGRRLIAQG